MVTFFSILALIILTLVFWLYDKDKNFSIERSRLIKAPVSEVFAAVSDLKQWPAWSPWLLHEPECTLVFSENSTSEESWYSWDGQKIGAGKIGHTQIVPNQSIQQSLEFTHPWKSNNAVSWSFKEQGEDTLVAWSMDGELPFLFRWMDGMMKHSMALDYDTGLTLLAQHIGDKTEAFAMNLQGVVGNGEQHFVTEAYRGSLEGMKLAMKSAFPRMLEALEANNIVIQGVPSCIYNKFNKDKLTVDCEMALPVPAGTEVQGFETRILPARPYLTSQLTGPYEGLEKAWHLSFTHLRMSKLKFRFDQPCLERYLNSPLDTDPADLKTELAIPVIEGGLHRAIADIAKEKTANIKGKISELQSKPVA